MRLHKILFTERPRRAASRPLGRRTRPRPRAGRGGLRRRPQAPCSQAARQEASDACRRLGSTQAVRHPAQLVRLLRGDVVH
eukprot:10791043-Alexandrium_andersonii.AAC.1